MGSQMYFSIFDRELSISPLLQLSFFMSLQYSKRMIMDIFTLLLSL